MAELIKCVACKKPVSSDLRQCPHCEEFPVEGTRCDICRVPMSQNSLLAEKKNIHSKDLSESKKLNSLFNKGEELYPDNTENIVHYECLKNVGFYETLEIQINDLSKNRDCPLCKSHAVSQVSHSTRLSAYKGSIGYGPHFKCSNCFHKYYTCQDKSQRHRFSNCNSCSYTVDEDSSTFFIKGPMSNAYHKYCSTLENNHIFQSECEKRRTVDRNQREREREIQENERRVKDKQFADSCSNFGCLFLASIFLIPAISSVIWLIVLIFQ